MPGKAPTAWRLVSEHLVFFFFSFLPNFLRHHHHHLSPRCQSASSCGAWSESPLPDISNLFLHVRLRHIAKLNQSELRRCSTRRVTRCQFQELRYHRHEFFFAPIGSICFHCSSVVMQPAIRMRLLTFSEVVKHNDCALSSALVYALFLSALKIRVVDSRFFLLA